MDESESPAAVMPAGPVRYLLPLFAVFHLIATGLSFFSVVEPSETQSRLLNFVRPYLQATHFGVDDRPLYLAEGASSEQPLRLQAADSAAPTEADWRTLDPAGLPGLAASDRRHRWLATAVMLAENEQPSLAAELLVAVAINDASIQALRIERLPATWRTGAVDAEPQPYTARVIRNGDRVSLVRVQEPRLNATATDVRSEENDG